MPADRSHLDLVARFNFTGVEWTGRKESPRCGTSSRPGITTSPCPTATRRRADELPPASNGRSCASSATGSGVVRGPRWRTSAVSRGLRSSARGRGGGPRHRRQGPRRSASAGRAVRPRLPAVHVRPTGRDEGHPRVAGRFDVTSPSASCFIRRTHYTFPAEPDRALRRLRGHRHRCSPRRSAGGHQGGGRRAVRDVEPCVRRRQTRPPVPQSPHRARGATCGTSRRPHRLDNELSVGSRRIRSSACSTTSGSPGPTRWCLSREAGTCVVGSAAGRPSAPRRFLLHAAVFRSKLSAPIHEARPRASARTVARARAVAELQAGLADQRARELAITAERATIAARSGDCSTRWWRGTGTGDGGRDPRPAPRGARPARCPHGRAGGAEAAPTISPISEGLATRAAAPGRRSLGPSAAAARIAAAATAGRARSARGRPRLVEGRERRDVEAGALQLGRAAAVDHRHHPDVDQLGRLLADHVRRQEAPGRGGEDQLQEAVRSPMIAPRALSYPPRPPRSRRPARAAPPRVGPTV